MEMKVTWGTVTGPGHKKDGTDNQDAFAFLQENGCTVIAAADGAGSLRLSGIGAQIASSTAVNETMDAILDGCEVVEAVRKGLDCARATLLEREDWREMGCTIALSAITSEGWATAVVGDAFAVVSLDSEDHVLHTTERSSEYANVTTLLTSDSYDPVFRSGADDVVAVTVATDGLLHASVTTDKRGNEPASGFWNPVIGRSMAGTMDLQSFLYYMDDNEKIEDDTTLVIAARQDNVSID